MCGCLPLKRWPSLLLLISSRCLTIQHINCRIESLLSNGNSHLSAARALQVCCKEFGFLLTCLSQCSWGLKASHVISLCQLCCARFLDLENSLKNRSGVIWWEGAANLGQFRELGRWRLPNRHLKSEVAMLLTLSRLFNLVQFVTCCQLFLELNYF